MQELLRTQEDRLPPALDSRKHVILYRFRQILNDKGAVAECDHRLKCATAGYSRATMA